MSLLGTWFDKEIRLLHVLLHIKMWFYVWAMDISLETPATRRISNTFPLASHACRLYVTTRIGEAQSLTNVMSLWRWSWPDEVCGLQQKRVYTSLGSSCPTCVHQSPWQSRDKSLERSASATAFAMRNNRERLPHDAPVPLVKKTSRKYIYPRCKLWY